LILLVENKKEQCMQWVALWASRILVRDKVADIMGNLRGTAMERLGHEKAIIKHVVSYILTSPSEGHFSQWSQTASMAFFRSSDCTPCARCRRAIAQKPATRKQMHNAQTQTPATISDNSSFLLPSQKRNNSLNRRHYTSPLSQQPIKQSRYAGQGSTLVGAMP